MTVVAGIDACRGGWVAVVLDAGEFTDSLFSASFAQLLGSLTAARAIGVDIPIGHGTHRRARGKRIRRHRRRDHQAGAGVPLSIKPYDLGGFTC